jgi:GTP-binding protein
MEVAFAGRSNVGKSSLLNALLQRRKLVRTSSTPGCTRQISLFEVTTRGGSRLTVVDLPGYGYAKRSRSERREWAELIDGYLLQRPALCLLVALVDARRGPEPDDEQLLQLIAQKPRVSRPPVGVVCVATKLDKIPASGRKLALEDLKRRSGRAWMGCSTELPDTLDRLWRHVLRRIELDQPAAAPPAAATPALSADPGAGAGPLTE